MTHAGPRSTGRSASMVLCASAPRVERRAPAPHRLLGGIGALVLALALALAATSGAAGALGSGSGTGGEDEPTTTSVTAPTTTLQAPVGGTTGNIIPRPGSGSAPQESGDRGSGAQLAVLGLTCAAILLIVGLVVRQSRQARARQQRVE